MTFLWDDPALDDLIRHHRTRIRDLSAGLLAEITHEYVTPERCSGDGLGYALLRRLLQQVADTKEPGERLQMGRSYLKVAESRTEHLDALEVMTVSATYSDETARKMVSEADLRSPTSDSRLGDRAAEVISSSSLRMHVGVVIATASGFDDVSRSSTLRAYPNWSVTERCSRDEIAVEAIVHEALHSRLNELLEATQVAGHLLHSGQYFSPWKAAPRHRFGFIHACFVFACLIDYWGQVGRVWSLSDEAQEYCRTRIDEERRNIAAVIDTLEEAVQPIGTAGRVVLDAAYGSLSLD